MPWTDKPGGGSNGKGPWGQQPANGSGGGDRRPDRKPQPAPDLEELLRSGRERFRRGGGGRSPRGGNQVEMPSKKVLGIGAAVLAGLYLFSGTYQVEPGQRGVVTTFGDYAGLTGPGLNWHVPWPFQDVTKVDVQNLNSVRVPGNGKASMLTSDLNIVDVDATVNWVIKSDAELSDGEMPNAAKFLFNVEEQREMIQAVTEAAMREVVGANEFEPIVSRGRAIVQDETREIVQRTLDEYESGIRVVRVNFGEATPPDAVVPAQTDVINARSQAEQRVNEAQRYANQIVPRSRGEARARVLEAEAYAAETVAEARGLASRFDDVYTEYVKAPEVTRQRLYLETMEDVLGDMNKVVIDNDAGGTLPYLNVNELARDARQGRQDQRRQAQGRQDQARRAGQNQPQTGGQ